MGETIEQEHPEHPERESQPLAPVQGGNPLDAPTEEFSGALQRRGDNRKALIEWVRDSLVEGVDFGKIKVKGKWSKPSLWKPGSEKICGMLGVTATFPRMADYEEAALSGVAINSIILRCHLVDGHGNIVADGMGARSLEQDNGDLNKALKMACKSAMIDATLRMAGLSEVFTQDVEDMIREGKMEGEAQQPDDTTPITEEQLAELRQLIHDTDTDEATFVGVIAQNRNLSVERLEDLPAAHYNYARNGLLKKAKKLHEQDEETLNDKANEAQEGSHEDHE